MGICNSKDKIDYDLIQSVIFYRNKAYNKEIVMWDLKRAQSYMAKRNWIWIRPPDESKQNQIRLHVEQEDRFETLEYQDINCGITIVFGKFAPGSPRRRKLLVRGPSKRSNVHTLADLHEQKE